MSGLPAELASQTFLPAELAKQVILLASHG